MTDAGELHVYAVGLCNASLCCPAEWDASRVLKEINHQEPTGLDHGWAHTGCKFRTGETNPCPCDQLPYTRKHWLVEC